MTKFILHGGNTRIDNESNRTFFYEIAKSVPDGGTILLVYFVYDSDPSPHFERQKKLLSENPDGKKFNLVFAEQEKFMDQLRDADAVYFHGGNTDKLLEIVRNLPNFEKALKGKTVAGSSAGAQIFSTYYYSARNKDAREGLGTLPIRFVCHYQSEDFGVGEDAIEELNKYPNELELVVLKDTEWKVFEK